MALINHALPSTAESGHLTCYFNPTYDVLPTRREKPVDKRERESIMLITQVFDTRVNYI